MQCCQGYPKLLNEDGLQNHYMKVDSSDVIFKVLVSCGNLLVNLVTLCISMVCIPQRHCPKAIKKKSNIKMHTCINYQAYYLHGCLNRIITSKNLAINKSKTQKSPLSVDSTHTHHQARKCRKELDKLINSPNVFTNFQLRIFN